MILDRQAALERIEHDQELYDEICGIFQDDVPKIMLLLKEAFSNGDIPVATRHAHSLKSAAANIGATDLCEMARRTENSFRSGDYERIHSLITDIDQNLSCVLAMLKQI